MLQLQINGHPRTLVAEAPVTLAQALDELGIKPDRVAVEHNGTIAPRASWSTTALAEDDRLEIVHFVGGGAS